jgi:hypothetical protein
MHTISRADTAVQPTGPTADDERAYLAWLAGAGDPGHAVGEPTPLPVLAGADDLADDDDPEEDLGAWWEWMPACPALDMPAEERFEQEPDDPEAFALPVGVERPEARACASVRWRAEGAHPVRRRPGYNPERDAILIDHLGRCEYPA